MVLETDGAHWRLGSIETPACETDDPTQKRKDEDELDEQTVAATATTQRKEKRVKIARKTRQIETKTDRKPTSERSWAIWRRLAEAPEHSRYILEAILGRQASPKWSPRASPIHFSRHFRV